MLRGASRELARAGLTVAMLCRDIEAAGRVAADIRAVVPGARTTLYLALSRDVEGVSGRCFDEFQKEQRALGVAYDLEQQEALWGASERITLSC